MKVWILLALFAKRWSFCGLWDRFGVLLKKKKDGFVRGFPALVFFMRCYAGKM